MKRLKVIIASTLLATSLVACKPRPAGLSKIAENSAAPPYYTMGWNDGCESGLAAFGNSFYKSIYKFKQRPALTTNEIYYKSWTDGFFYCRHYGLRFTADPIDQVDNIFKDQPGYTNGMFPGTPEIYNW